LDTLKPLESTTLYTFVQSMLQLWEVWLTLLFFIFQVFIFKVVMFIVWTCYWNIGAKWIVLSYGKHDVVVWKKQLLLLNPTKTRFATKFLMVERLFKLKLAIEQIVVDLNWTILRVFSIPFNFTCSLLFFIFNLLKLSTSMGFFPNLKYQNTKNI